MFPPQPGFSNTNNKMKTKKIPCVKIKHINTNEIKTLE
jgi:hypothetical protein